MRVTTARDELPQEIQADGMGSLHKICTTFLKGSRYLIPILIRHQRLRKFILSEKETSILMLLLEDRGGEAETLNKALALAS
jgi:hypothetical protein